MSFTDEIHNVQVARLLAPSPSRSDLRLHSTTACDGSALFVGANRKRTNAWVEGTGQDGVRRQLHLHAERAPGRGLLGMPGVLSTLTFSEDGHPVFSMNYSLFLQEKTISIAVAGSAQAPAKPRYCYLKVDFSGAASPAGVVRVVGTHHGLGLPSSLCEEISVKGHPTDPRFDVFKSVQEAFSPELARVSWLLPFLELVASRYELRGRRMMMSGGIYPGALDGLGQFYTISLMLDTVPSSRTKKFLTAVAAGVFSALAALATGGGEIMPAVIWGLAGFDATIWGEIIHSWGSEPGSGTPDTGITPPPPGQASNDPGEPDTTGGGVCRAGFGNRQQHRTI